MFSRRFFMSAVVITGSVGYLGGCASERGGISGVVTRPSAPLAPGATVPDFLVTTEGRQRHFKSLRELITILAFVQTDGDKCCWLNPELVSLADELRLQLVSVVQVTTPEGDCAHGAGCTVACQLDDPHLIALCDAQGIALEAYRSPAPGTVFLTNHFGKVEMVGKLSDLDVIRSRAITLADAREEWHRRGYEN